MGDLDEQITVRMSYVQRETWERAAAKDQRKLADWIRLRLDRCALAELPAEECEPVRVKPKRKKRRR